VSHVLFWDIDGTLLTTGRAGVFALEQAAREVCGVTELHLGGLETAGLTDAEIAEAIIRHCGLQCERKLQAAFLRSYEHHLPDRLGWRKGEVLPGVEAVLDALRDREDVTLLLLTGNTRAGALAKLAHYELGAYFSGGAFCGDRDDRETIARRAIEVAADVLGARPDPETLHVIGDTPHDVHCGKAIGSRTVAVASGQYSAEVLRACGPTLTLERLPDPAAFLRLLGVHA
jgi:phosphoglycolate phosphatase